MRAHQEWQARSFVAREERAAEGRARYRIARERAFNFTTSNEASWRAESDAFEMALRSSSDDSQLNFFTYASAGSGNDPFNRYVDSLEQNFHEQVEASKIAVGSLFGRPDPERPTLTPPELFRRAEAIADGGAAIRSHWPEELPSGVTNFQSRGTDLVSAARNLAKGYGELAFHADDPDLTVADTFGAQSLDHLAAAWGEAMSQKTPLAAGQFVLRSLAE